MSTPRLAQDDAAHAASVNRNMSEGTGQVKGGASAAAAAATAANAGNFGSARSDYGENAYGGTLDATGQGGAGVDDYAVGRVDRGSRGYSTTLGRGGDGQRSLNYGRSAAASAGGSTLLALLAGMGIGAGLMYLLDPERGRTRRAYLRDQLTIATNRAGEQIDKTSRHLRNRVQGVVAETRGVISHAGDSVNETIGSLGLTKASAKQETGNGESI